MATVRQEIAARIKADHPSFRVCEYPNEPTQVSKGRPYVDVYVTDLANEPDHRIIHTVKLDCYAARTHGPEAEDEAEDVRDDVLLSLQRMQHVAWSTAQRSVFNDTFIGYQITATFISNHVYAAIIRAEHQEK